MPLSSPTRPVRMALASTSPLPVQRRVEVQLEGGGTTTLPTTAQGSQIGDRVRITTSAATGCTVAADAAALETIDGGASTAQIARSSSDYLRTSATAWRSVPTANPATTISAVNTGIGIGLAAPGPVTLAQAQIGDTVQGVIDIAAGADRSANFEAVISAAGSILQTGGVLTAQQLLVTLTR